MAVQQDLKRIREILVKIADRPDCAEITGFDKIAIECFVEGLDRAIKHYEREAKRVGERYRSRLFTSKSRITE